MRAGLDADQIAPLGRCRLHGIRNDRGLSSAPPVGPALPNCPTVLQPDGVADAGAAAVAPAPEQALVHGLALLRLVDGGVRIPDIAALIRAEHFLNAHQQDRGGDSVL
jgi:hypothetical protein